VGKGENAPEKLNARLIIHIVDRAGATSLGRAMMVTSKIFEAVGVQVEVWGSYLPMRVSSCSLSLSGLLTSRERLY